MHWRYGTARGFFGRKVQIIWNFQSHELGPKEALKNFPSAQFRYCKKVFHCMTNNEHNPWKSQDFGILFLEKSMKFWHSGALNNPISHPLLPLTLPFFQGIYNPGQVKYMERRILRCLGWRLHRPTGHTFTDFIAARLLFKSNWTPPRAIVIVRHLAVARYCLNYGLLSTPFSSFLPR